MGRRRNRGFILKKLIVILMVVFSTLTIAGDKTFEDISTSPEVLMPVLVGGSFLALSAPLIFISGVSKAGKIFSAVGLASIATGVATGAIIYALDN
jgi:hypothetical protein